MSLPEEGFKYFDIFKKTLSGTIGKNLLRWNFRWNRKCPGEHGVFAQIAEQQARRRYAAGRVL